MLENAPSGILFHQGPQKWVWKHFPALIELYLQKRLDLDAFVSETIGLEDVEAAFTKMEHGEVLRSVVVW